MNIKLLILNNFRGFEQRTFGFDKRFNVLIGDNATGKTAVLDAIAIGLSTFYKGLDFLHTKGFKKDDVRRKSFEESNEAQLPVYVTIEADINDRLTSWTRRQDLLRGSAKVVNGDSILTYAKLLKEKVRNGEQVDLPVFSYYGTGRLWKEKSFLIQTKAKSSRFEGYINALDSFSNSKFFLRWMKTREIASLQKNIDPAPLSVVKDVIQSFLVMHEKVFYDIMDDTLVMETNNSQHLHDKSMLTWGMLSDGYRNVIGMAADLAFRCVTLNPHLKERAALDSKGIVLIDELDLHLHPNWQKRIVENFKEAFPNMQFITSTHSPFIIQSLKNQELIDLEGKNLDTDYFRKSIEEIAGEEMGVENVQRSKLFEEMQNVAAEYFKLIREGKNDETANGLKHRLDELQELYSEDPAFVALLKAERDKANID